ncbi:MAG: sigma-70 family RNA polymerase sigma factor [Gammaproteobacteria bacterium]|nr:sigma-70 family RNA polymerase sigma factor [Gammaproteobacteria bacterium]
MLAQYQQAIEKYRQRVFSFAYYSLRAREDAEDITQEVFIRLWQHWHKVEHDRMGAWLMRVAHNCVVDHVRKHQSDKQRVELHDFVDGTAGVEEAGPESQRFRQQLETAISELTDPYRSIIILRDVQGLSYAEIEQTLNLNQSQVKVYLHRGRRQLRDNQTLRQLARERAIINPEIIPLTESMSGNTNKSNVEGTSHVKQ